MDELRDSELFSFQRKADAVDLLLRLELEDVLRRKLGVKTLNHREAHYIGIGSIDYSGAVTIEFKSSFMTYHMELFGHRARMETNVDRKLGDATNVRIKEAYNSMIDSLSRSREIAEEIYHCHDELRDKFLELSGKKLWRDK